MSNQLEKMLKNILLSLVAAGLTLTAVANPCLSQNLQAETPTMATPEPASPAQPAQQPESPPTNYNTQPASAQPYQPETPPNQGYPPPAANYAQPTPYEQPQYGQPQPYSQPPYGQPAPTNQPAFMPGQTQSGYAQYSPPQVPSGYPAPMQPAPAQNFAAPTQPFAQYGGYQPPNQFYGQPPASGPGYGPGYGAPPQYVGDLRGSTAYAPEGLVIPITLQTSISTQVAKAGDYIQASIAQNVSLGGYSYIPAGTVAVGQISDSTAGRRLSRSGALSIDFNSLRMPNGVTIPISAHLLGSIGKYKDVGKDGQDLYRGEGWGTKAGQFLLRGGLGAGLGAGLGTAVGAIGGGGYGAGMGAWSGAAIGGGIGAADMLLRKGKDVIIPSGTQMQLQLNQQASIPVEAPLGAPQQPPSSVGNF